MSGQSKSLLQWHGIIVILAFTAILGKLITLDAAELVLYRMALAALGLWLYLVLFNHKWIATKGSGWKLLSIGGLVAVHWILFFHAIKISNVSVTLGCLGSTAFFTSLFEPIFLQKRMSRLDVLMGLLVVVGIYLIFQFEFHFRLGIVIALASAAVSALFTVLNKRYLGPDNSSSVMTLYEMVGGAALVGLWLFATDESLSVPGLTDGTYLLILAWLCTAFAFVVSIQVMRHLSAFTVNFVLNLEPIYGIVMALLIFSDSEHLTNGFYGGAAIVMLSVFLHPILGRMRIKKGA